jgi:DNA-binding transcriptional LysR family regulator
MKMSMPAPLTRACAAVEIEQHAGGEGVRHQQFDRGGDVLAAAHAADRQRPRSAPANMPALAGYAAAVDDMLKAMGRSRTVQVSVNSFLLVPALIEASDLVATVPARLARRWGPRVAVLPPPCEVPGFSVAMAWHPRAHPHPAHAWLRETLREALAADPQS